jgi:hypothetical protein
MDDRDLPEGDPLDTCLVTMAEVIANLVAVNVETHHVIVELIQGNTKQAALKMKDANEVNQRVLSAMRPLFASLRSVIEASYVRRT